MIAFNAFSLLQLLPLIRCRVFFFIVLYCTLSRKVPNAQHKKSIAFGETWLRSWLKAQASLAFNSLAQAVSRPLARKSHATSLGRAAFVTTACPPVAGCCGT